MKKEFTEKPLVLTRSETEFVQGTNSFTFNLFKAALTSDQHDGRDIMISPLSASFVLGALNNGTTGEWKNKFREEDTEKEVFTGINGSFSMYVILPDEGVDFNDFIASLDSEVWNDVLTSTGRYHDVRFKMPKLDVECSFDLIDMMKELGVRKAFSPDEAEFTEMRTDAGSLYLGLLKQKSRIIVDESGTKAAAVTIGGMEEVMAPPSNDQPIIFHADRPFVYLIQEDNTGTIYFIGAKLRP